TGEHIDRLVDVIRDREREGGELLHLEIPHADARLIAQLHERAEVYEQATNDETVSISAWVPNNLMNLFRAFVTAARKRRASQRWSRGYAVAWRRGTERLRNPNRAAAASPCTPIPVLLRSAPRSPRGVLRRR